MMRLSDCIDSLDSADLLILETSPNELFSLSVCIELGFGIDFQNPK